MLLVDTARLHKLEIIEPAIVRLERVCQVNGYVLYGFLLNGIPLLCFDMLCYYPRYYNEIFFCHVSFCALSIQLSTCHAVLY